MRARTLSGFVTATLVAGTAATVVFAPPALAAGCTNNWIGPSSGTQDWFTAANWSAGVPVSSDDVCITKNGTYTVDLLSGAGVNSLTIGGTTGTQTFRVNGVNTSLQFNTGPGSASSIGTHGAVVLAPSANGYALFGGNGATLANSGSFSTTGTNTAYVRIGLTNRAAGTVSIANPDTRQDNGTATTNAGSWTVTGTGSYRLEGGSTFAQNAGTLVTNGTFVQNGGTFFATGGAQSGANPIYTTGGGITDSAMTGAIAVRGSGTFTGNIPTGQTVTIDAATTSVSLGIVGGTTVSGTLATASSPSGYTILSDAGSGSVTVAAGGTLSTSDIAASQPTYLRVPITNNGTVTIGAATNYFDQGSPVANTGTFTVASGATAGFSGGMTFTQTSGTIAVGGTFALSNGTFAANGGSTTGANPVDVGGATLAEGNPGTSGKFRFLASGTLSGNVPAAQTVTGSGANGSISVNVSGTVIVRGTLDLAPTAGGYVILGDAGSAAITVANGGTLSTHGASDAQPTYLRVPITNNAGASISINAPTNFADYGHPLTNAGTLTVDSAAALYVSGGPTVTQSAGTLDVQGTFRQDNGTFNATGGAVTSGAVILGQTTLVDSGTTGSFRLRSGTQISGTVPSGQTATVDTAAGASSTSVDGTLTVQGTYALEQGAAGYALVGDGGSGLISVASGGTFASIGSGSTNYLRVPLTVQAGGTANFTAPSTTQDYSTATTNNGTTAFGDGAQLSMNGGSTFVNGANSRMDVTANGTAHTSSLVSGGALTANGTLAVTTIGSPGIGDTFTPVTSAVSGTFTDYDFLDGGYSVAYGANSVTLTAVDVFAVTPAAPFKASKAIPTGPVPVATITNAGAGTGTYSATVTWGDNTAPVAATVSGSGGTRTVTAPSHTYAASGTYTLTTRVHNSNGTTRIVTTTVTVPVLKVTSVSPDNGYTLGGTRVTLRGSGFTGATAVKFDGTNGTALSVVSDTQLRVTTPAHAAGTVTVRVYTPGGASPVVAAASFTYVVPPPTVTSITPTEGPAAGGQSVTITGTDLTGATGVAFGGIPAASFTVVNDTTITAVTPLASAATVAVTVTTAGGTSDGSVTYTFVAAPRITGLTPTTGPTTGGNRVVIAGVNLTGATSVTFGGVAATNLTVVNDHKITVIAPAGSAGLVNVRVTTVGGTSAVTSNGRYTYVAPPEVTNVSPRFGPTTGGTTVTITGTHFTGTVSVRFGTVQATGFTVVSDTQLTAVSPGGAAGRVYVRVRTAGGGTTPRIADARFTYQ